MKIIPLSEGAFTIDQTKQFIPFDLQNDDLQQRTKGSLLVEIQPFAVVTSKDVILLDTGLGFSDNEGILQIHNNLKKQDIDPASVTKVLLSHLHKDHASGISHEDPLTKQQDLSFPNATYYVNRQELEHAFEKEGSSYKPAELEILKSSSQLVLLDGNGIIDDYIRYELSGGHSPYHLVFWIIDEGEKVFFGGDVAPQLQQMRSRFVAKYDYDGKKSMELRQQWLDQGQKEKWTFLFYHDIKSPVHSFG